MTIFHSIIKSLRNIAQTHTRSSIKSIVEYCTYVPCFLLLVCGKIDNCLHRDCGDNNEDLICVWCEGEIAEMPYWKAYNGALDGRKSCKSKR